MIILKWILNTGDDVSWIEMAWDRDVVTGFCEHSYGPSCFINISELSGQRSYCRLIRKYCFAISMRLKLSQ